MMRDFQRDSARREVATQKALEDIHAVGFSIVKTLNLHTRILERIERKVPPWGTGHPRRRTRAAPPPGGSV